MAQQPSCPVCLMPTHVGSDCFVSISISASPAATTKILFGSVPVGGFERLRPFGSKSVTRNPTALSGHTALVTFETAEAAALVMAQPQSIDGKLLTMRYYPDAVDASASATLEHKCYIGNLPYDATEDGLLDFLQQEAGLLLGVELADARIMRDLATGRSKEAAAKAVREASGKVYNGRAIVISLAVARPAPVPAAAPAQTHQMGFGSARPTGTILFGGSLGQPHSSAPKVRKQRGFAMELFAGNEEEYHKRHNEIWPELSRTLKEATVSNYNIYLHGTTLFAFMEYENEAAVDALKEVVQRWWRYMGPLMRTNSDCSPVVTPLKQVFYLP